MSSESLHPTPLDQETAEIFLDRIADQASYNTPYLPDFDTEILAIGIVAPVIVYPVGRAALNGLVSSQVDDKFPRARQTGADMEDTQEISMQELLHPQPIRAIYPIAPIAPQRRVVTLSEDPGKFPAGINRTRFVL